MDNLQITFGVISSIGAIAGIYFHIRNRNRKNAANHISITDTSIGSQTIQQAEQIIIHNINQQMPSISTAEPNKITSVTVKNIIDNIHDAPPFQRDSIAQNYHGIKVSWEGALWDVKKVLFPGTRKDDVRVRIHPEAKNLHYSIDFEVDIKKYPQLKIAKRGDLIGVIGRIIACSSEGMLVELDVDDITFHEKR